MVGANAIHPYSPTGLFAKIIVMSEQQKNPRQREHQANERTFLAWLRTSIALIGFGLAIARFGLFLQQSQINNSDNVLQNTLLIDPQILGISLIGLGLVIVVLAAFRYNQVYQQIERVNYRPNRFIIWFVTGLIMLLGAMSLPIVWGGNKQPEKPKTSSLNLLPK